MAIAVRLRKNAYDADKPKYDFGRLTVTFRIAFLDGEAGDKARAILPDAVKQSHERYCTVSRTVELGTPITTRIE